MSYTIVYDRRFLKCRDRYIPLALSGDNKVTEINYSTGREVRCRSWSTFIYDYDMLLGTAEKIMEIVAKYHPKDSHNGEGFKFHGNWMDDAAAYRFSENGIRDAMTIEDIAWQTGENCLIGEIRVYQKDYTYDKDLSSKQAYLHTSDEIYEWVENAKKVRQEILDAGKANSAYVCLGFSGPRPLKVSVIRDRNIPYIAEYRKRLGKGRLVKSYVEQADSSRMSYTQDHEKAMVFHNIDDAYLRIPRWARDSIALVPAGTVTKRVERAPSKYILTAVLHGRRVIIERRTRGSTYYTSVVTENTKRFRTEAAALKWFDEMLSGRSHFSEPKAELVA